MQDLCILATGGTIDKVHDPVTEKLVFTQDSLVPQILKECRVKSVRLEVLMLKDSLDLTDADREIILDAVQNVPENRVVITHGTGTMEITASYLSGKVGDKTIVLTGAMRPFSLHNSDAGFNLGSALSCAKLANPGVYITMNGLIFEGDKVTKNRETGFFEEA